MLHGMNNSPNEAIPENTVAAESDDIALELRTLWHGLVRDSERAAHLDRQQYWVLGALKQGPTRMTALAEAAQTSQASLTGIVDRMEDRGLVERLRSSADRRVVEVVITDAGLAELRRVHAAFFEQIQATLAPLGDAERVEFLRVLRKLNANAPTRCERH
jgi:DNA-binding MarR family transcriptional regulator